MVIPEELIPIAGMLMVLGIVAIVFWFKARDEGAAVPPGPAHSGNGTPAQDEGARNRAGKSQRTFFQQLSRVTRGAAAQAGGRSLPMSPFLIPLAVFAMVVLIVAITQVAKIRDRKWMFTRSCTLEEMEHQRKMRELELELERIKQGT